MPEKPGPKITDGFSEETIRAAREGRSLLGPKLTKKAQANLARIMGPEAAKHIAEIMAPPIQQPEKEDGLPEEMIQKILEERDKKQSQELGDTIPPLNLDGENK